MSRYHFYQVIEGGKVSEKLTTTFARHSACYLFYDWINARKLTCEAKQTWNYTDLKWWSYRLLQPLTRQSSPCSSLSGQSSFLQSGDLTYMQGVAKRCRLTLLLLLTSFLIPTVGTSVDPDPHPDPLGTSTDPAPDPSIIKQKWEEKPWFLVSTVLWLLFMTFHDCSESGSVGIRMFLGFPNPTPDALDRGADPRIRIRVWIRTNMSRIHNTGWDTEKVGSKIH